MGGSRGISVFFADGRFVAIAAVLFVSVSCISAAADDRYSRRINNIEYEYENIDEDIASQYDSAKSAFKALRETKFPVAKKRNYLPKRPIYRRANFSDLRTRCDELSSLLGNGHVAESTQSNDTPGAWILKDEGRFEDGDIEGSYEEDGSSFNDELHDLEQNPGPSNENTRVTEMNARAAICWEQYSKAYVEELTSLYWGADLAWIQRHFEPDPIVGWRNLEGLFVYSHNMRIEAYVISRLAQIKLEKRKARRKLRRWKREAIKTAKQRHEVEVSAARRKFAAVVAAGVEGYNNAGRRTGTRNYSGPGVSVSSPKKACSSDFVCGIGYKCVKSNYSGAGFCAKAVNSYGNQTFDLPDLDSVFVKTPNVGDCKFNLDCPVGFSCDRDSGACLK